MYPLQSNLQQARENQQRQSPSLVDRPEEANITDFDNVFCLSRVQYFFWFQLFHIASILGFFMIRS